MIPVNEFYDYESKYTEGMMSFEIPAPVSDEVQAEVGRLAAPGVRVARLRRLRALRLLLEPDSGRVLLNEINTIPGMTAMSGFPRLWAATGVSNEALVEEIVQLGLQRHAARSGLRTDQ